MSSQSETPGAAQPQPALPAAGQEAKVDAKATGKKTTSPPSAAKLRADQAKVDNWIALIRAIGTSIGANCLVVGLLIVFGIAVWKDSEEAYAPICALLGTLVGIWLKRKERADASQSHD